MGRRDRKTSIGWFVNVEDITIKTAGSFGGLPDEDDDVLMDFWMWSLELFCAA